MKTIIKGDETIIYEQVGLMPVSLCDRLFNSDQRICLSLPDGGAEEKGAYKNDIYGTNNYSTSARADSSEVFYGIFSGVRDRDSSFIKSAGLRVVFATICDPKRNIDRDCEVVEETVKVYDNGTPEYTKNGEEKTIKGKKNIFNFNGHRCDLVIREECESGKAGLDICLNDLGEECAKPFDKEGKHNDYGRATELREQCERYLMAGAKPEELALLVTRKRTSKDGYESMTPVLSLETHLGVIQAYDKYISSERTKADRKTLDRAIFSFVYEAQTANYSTEMDRKVALRALKRIIDNKEEQLKRLAVKERQGAVVEKLVTGKQTTLQEQQVEAQEDETAGRKGEQLPTSDKPSYCRTIAYKAYVQNVQKQDGKNGK